MEKAFTYMFKDNMLKQKAALYFVLYFGVFCLSNFASLYAKNRETIIYAVCAYILYIILYLLVLGYSISCIKAVTEQGEDIVLPFLNFGKNLWLGFKYFLSIVVITILIGGIDIGLILIPVMLLSNTNPASIILGVILLLIFMLLIVASFILFLIYTPALVCIFAKTEWITSFCRFVRATKLIKNDPGQYFLAILLYIGILLAIGIIVAIPMLMYTFTNNISLLFVTALISAIASTYSVYVYSYILAKCVNYKLIEE